VRDDFYAAQDSLESLLNDRDFTILEPLATEDDYRLIASRVDEGSDNRWRDIAGARRRWLRFVVEYQYRSDEELMPEAEKLHHVLDVARRQLGEIVGLDFRPHRDG